LKADVIFGVEDRGKKVSEVVKKHSQKNVKNSFFFKLKGLSDIQMVKIYQIIMIRPNGVNLDRTLCQQPTDYRHQVVSRVSGDFN
jgi:hypothetical protein